MQKLSDKKIKIIHRNGQSVSGPLASKKAATLFGLFNFQRAQAPAKNFATLPKESASESSQVDVPRADLAAVKNWVALEEKIVHGYKEQKTVKSSVPLTKAPVKSSLPAFETFSTQTAVSSSSNVPSLKDPRPDLGRTFLGLGKFLLVMGWLATGVLALLYFQETFVNRETSQKLAQIQSEKTQLEQSYAALKTVSEDQSAEIAWLNSQLHDRALELKAAKSEIAALQGAARTQNAIVDALRAQSQAFEKIVDQGGMSAFSGAAAGLSQEQFPREGASAIQGQVTSVNERQGFAVISMGASQGAHPGRWITISRGGRGLAVGRVDRVYPTMSVVVLRQAGMLQMIQEGDSVFFS